MADNPNPPAAPAVPASAAPAAAAPALKSKPETPAPDMLTQLRDALQGEAVAVQRRERDAIGRMLDSHDAQRAKLPVHKLVAVTDFTIVDDEHPEGRIVKMGEEFDVSEFDLPRYLGRGLPRANEPTEGGGVTISQA